MADKENPKLSKPEIVQEAFAQLVMAPAGYRDLLEDLKKRIRTIQLRAGLFVNKELILLYWDIGRRILQRQQQEGYSKEAYRVLRSWRHPFRHLLLYRLK
jgi:hypothetical protein